MLSLVDRDELAPSVAFLESTAQRLREAARRHGLDPEVAKRLSRVGEELASHALAARVLVSSGASAESLRTVLDRATTILEEELREGGDLVH